MEQKKRMNAEQKIMILRELLENKMQIGELSEKYGIHPNVIYNWKKILFEKGSQLFADTRERTSAKAEQMYPPSAAAGVNPAVTLNSRITTRIRILYGCGCSRIWIDFF